MIPMRKITLDCAGLTRPALHEAFARALDFPAWYGNNLDALYDCLTDLEEETNLTVCNLADEPFRLTLEDGAKASRYLTVTFE